MKLLTILFLSTIMSTSLLVGCDADDGPVEEAAENVDETIEEAGDSVEEATD